jgi:ParB-like chromosome segregation protein Spo0J
MGNIANLVEQLIETLSGLSEIEQVQQINYIRRRLHAVSPFKNEPTDCVLWVKSDDVFANDYNPNKVAPPEMKLLELSISEDGYTQPIVSLWDDDEQHYEVIDGFHRNRVGKECESVKKRVHGYLPITLINNDRQDKSDRIAATIRHNRARGKHQITAMSDIVVDLCLRNWSDAKIGRELGM